MEIAAQLGCELTVVRLKSWLVSSRPIPTSAAASFRIQKPAAAAEEEESVDGEIEAAEEWSERPR